MTNSAILRKLPKRVFPPKSAVVKDAAAVRTPTDFTVTCRLVSANQAHDLWPRIDPLLRAAWRKLTARSAIAHYWRPEDVYAMVTSGRALLVAVLGYGYLVIDRQQIPFSSRFMLYVWLAVASQRVPRWARRAVQLWVEGLAYKVGASRVAFLSNRRGMERWALRLGYQRGSTWYIKDLATGKP
jgi:hypothetical protein